jgi:putative transposase
VLNRTQYPSDVIALVVLWRLRYRLTLQDLSEMFLTRGIVFSHEAVRDWEAKLTPVLTAELRHRCHGKGGAGRRSWHVDETYLKVRGRWCYLYRAIDRNGDLVKVGARARARRERNAGPDTMLSEPRDMAAVKAFLRSAKSATRFPPRPPAAPISTVQSRCCATV